MRLSRFRHSIAKHKGWTQYEADSPIFRLRSVCVGRVLINGHVLKGLVFFCAVSELL